MSDQKHSTQERPRHRIPANQPDNEQRAEGQANTTGAQPGMPQHNEQGKPTGTDDREAQADPNPGPGIVSQGHRVDEDTPTHGDQQDNERKQGNAPRAMPSNDRPRDQDKDRKEPMDERQGGDDKSE